MLIRYLINMQPWAKLYSLIKLLSQKLYDQKLYTN